MSEHAGTEYENDWSNAPLEKFGSIGVFLSDPDGTCTFINARGCEITGLSREKVIGKSWVHGLSPANRGQLSPEMFEDVEGGQAARARYRYERPDGTSTWVQIEAVPQTNPGGRVTGFVGTIIDIADREDAPRELARLESDLEDTQRLAQVGSWSWDASGCELRWSDEHYRIFGIEPGETELDYGVFLKAVHPKDRDRVRVRLGEAYQRRERFEIEYQILRPNGEERLVHGSGEMDVDRDGNPLRMRGTSQDITALHRSDDLQRAERARLEDLVSRRTRALELAHKQLRDAERLASVGSLATGIAQEIRDPLSAILDAARRALASEADHDAGDLQALGDTAREAKRCSQIIQDLIDYARSDPDRGSEDTNRVVQRACTLMTHCALEKSAMIEFEPTRDPIEASIGPIELEQVVVNVLRNAIESRTLGARVQVATALRGDSILISVRDDGCGISRDALPRVFEAFFTTRSDAGGIGLGMAVAHQIVSQHHGSIDLESQPGMGTTVTISLPCIGSAAARD